MILILTDAQSVGYSWTVAMELAAGTKTTKGTGLKMKDKFTMIFREAGERADKTFESHADMVKFIKRPGIEYLSSKWPDWYKKGKKK